MQPSFAQTLTPAQAARQIGGCSMYPSTNIWNTPVDSLPADPNSDVYITAAGPDSSLHPDFGQNPAYGIPINVIASDTPRVKVHFQDKADSDPGQYPIASDALVERGSDHHLLEIVAAPRCTLYELFAVTPVRRGQLGRHPNGSIGAYEGNFVDLTSNQLRPIPADSSNGISSADAAGLEIAPALVRYEEVASGEILHALRFTLPQTQAAFVWPARHYASNSSDPTLLPMGARLRLKSSVDISQFSGPNQVILTAMKKYGLMLADNGSSLFVSGSPDPRWNDDDLSNLKTLHLSDFEVVSLGAIANLQFQNNSGRVDPMNSPAQ